MQQKDQLPRTSLDQWAILRAVVKYGTFAEAAHMLSRSQSSVSYAVARLQEALGVTLTEMQGRRAVLTEAGRMLLAEVAPLIDDLAALEARASGIAAAGSAPIRLRVDSLFPRLRLMEALETFSYRYPHNPVEIRETERGGVPDPKAEPFDLAIALPNPRRMEGRRLRDVIMVPAARADHPLTAAGPDLRQADLVRHMRVIVREAEPPGDLGTQMRGRIWQVSTVEGALAAVRSGHCYGWLPREMIAGDLAGGRLKLLKTATDRTRTVSLDLMYADPDHASAAVHHLADCLMALNGALPD
ncbi:LysR family transcriptional regulator [Frigidibacter sp. MR17.14]|uniref:LysR family transcriptional regulator n=1 Tax=Frigidibacter sp. MR17.14 TaxID=3126509 RepID=UPI003012F34E